MGGQFSSPFLGTFFQWEIGLAVTEVQEAFSSPFLGTFFQWNDMGLLYDTNEKVFVPFLGDFLSMMKKDILDKIKPY